MNGEDPIKNTNIEQDIQELEAIDKQISDLVQRRYNLVDRIQEKHHYTGNRMQTEKDWYEGSIRGNPVPDRNEEAPEYSSDTGPAPSRGRW